MDRVELTHHEQGICEEQSGFAEIDWERPPVYELHGSGENATTSVIAQGDLKVHDGGKAC